MGVIIIFLVILGAIFFGSYSLNNRLVNTGEIIEREAGFNEKTELLYTTAEYEALREEIYKGPFFFPDKTDEEAETSGFMKWAKKNGTVNVKEDPKLPLFLFYKPVEWSAVFSKVSEQDGKNVYEFRFEKWRTRNGVTDKTGMNMTLTYIEKAILRLDPDATYEMKAGSFKKKWIS